MSMCMVHCAIISVQCITRTHAQQTFRTSTALESVTRFPFPLLRQQHPPPLFSLIPHTRAFKPRLFSTCFADAKNSPHQISSCRQREQGSNLKAVHLHTALPLPPPPPPPPHHVSHATTPPHRYPLPPLPPSFKGATCLHSITLTACLLPCSDVLHRIQCKIIVDGTFCQAVLQCKISLRDQLPSYLGCKVNLM